MPLPHPELLKQQALKLTLEGLTPTQIKAKLGLPLSTLKNWVYKNNIPDIKSLVQTAAKTEVQREVNQRSDAIRSKLGDVIANQVEMLAENPAVCVEDLRNTPDRQGLAAVAKTVTETASQLFGWDAEKPTGLILVADVRAFDQPVSPASVEVESSLVVSEGHAQAGSTPPIDIAGTPESTRPL